MSAMFESNESDLTLVNRGKVRDVYRLADGDLLIVATDRISAFDYVLPTPIPGKGEVLTQLSNFWFDKTTGIIANHLVDRDPFAGDAAKAHLRGRSVVVKSARSLPVEAIVRGYLAGSGLKEYRAQRTVCGIALPKAWSSSSKLARADLHALDQGRERAPTTRTSPSRGRSTCWARRWRREGARRFAGALLDSPPTTRATGASSSPTPSSSSACWTASSSSSTRRSRPTRRASGRPTPTRPGRPQPSYDKQFVRDYLEGIGWDKRAAGARAAARDRREDGREVPGGAAPADGVGGASRRARPTTSRQA